MAEAALYIFAGLAIFVVAIKYADRRQRNPVRVDEDDEAYGDVPHVGGR